MPRPKKNTADRLTATVRFRTTEAARFRIEQDAVTAGLSAAEYARRRTLSGKVVIVPSPVLPPLVFDELRRISINLNQLLRIAGDDDHTPPALLRVSTLVEQILFRQLDLAPAKRRKKADAAPHTASVAFRTTDAEHLETKSKAKTAGITSSEYARRQTLYGKVVVVQERALNPAVLGELEDAGVSINRRARSANQTGSLPHELPAICGQLEQIIIAHHLAEVPAPRQIHPANAPAPGSP